MRISLQSALLAALFGVALIYFATPSRAEDSCRTWSAEVEDDEGGPVLTASACSNDSSEARLSLKCFSGKVWLEYDLGVGGDREPEYDETATVEFVTDAGAEAVPMTFQAMNAMFGGETPAEGPLTKLLMENASVLVRDQAGAYPARTYSLKGSRAAIKALVDQCG